MISALRKIRKKLLDQNKAKRYVLYAIGEIVLVVIGILIALQINTWNKEKHNLKLEKALLENFKADLIIQKELLDEQITFELDVISKVDSARQFTSPNFNKATLPRRIHELGGRHTFKVNRATFNNMIANGGVTLIHDTELQNKIIRYYQQLEYTESVCNNNNLYMIDTNFGAFEANNALGFEVNTSGELLPDIQFNNKQRYLLRTQLQYRFAASESIRDLSKDLLEATEELINQIDTSLKH